MKYALLLLILLVPSVTALQFLTPTNGATYTSPATVTYTWDDQNATATINGATYTNTTNATVTLTTGTYLATLTDGNTTVNNTVNVTAPTPTQSITVTTDKPVYEVSTAARIAVGVTTPGQLTLTVNRNGVLADTYTITVQQQTDFLYTLLGVGSYTVAVTGQGASATTSFTVQNTTLGVAISGSDTVSAGRIASFAATATGGTAPYTYFWQFSDNTTSTGQTVEHVFAQNGTYTVTVVAQDTTSKQASATKTITVSEITYTLDITVMGDNNKLLKNAVAVLTGANGGRTAKTDHFGEARFRTVSAGNYTLNVTYNYTGVTPSVLYSQNLTLVVDSDDDIKVSLPVPDPQPVQNTTPNKTTTSPTTNPTTPITPQAKTVEQPVETAQPTQTETATQTATQSTEEALAAKKDEFEAKRTKKMEEARALQTALFRSEEKQTVLATLGLDTSYSAAQQAMAQAATEYELETILKSLPKEVTIITKDTAIQNEDQIATEQLINEFFTSRVITNSGEQRQYEYSIAQVLPNVTITAKRTVVSIANYDGTRTTYTLFSRIIDAPTGTVFIEFIPKEVAADASALHVEGSHEVLVADPVIRFMSPVYQYYVRGDVPALPPRILPVPSELSEAPSVLGFVAVKLKLRSFERGGLYLALIALIFCVAVAGNFYLRRVSSSPVPDFTELAETSVTYIEKGNFGLAAKILPEVEAIHKTLKPIEQEQTKEILVFLQHAAAVHEFRTSVDHAHTAIGLADTVAIANAYERASQRFEALPAEYKEREKHTFASINSALEQHLLGAEGK
jgi:PKD repeat protein